MTRSTILPALALLLCVAPACGDDPAEEEEGGAQDGGGGAPDAAAPDAGGGGDAGTDSGAPAAKDCTQSQEPCIAAEGVRDGQRFTCVSGSPIEDVSRIAVGTKRWAIHCDDGLEDFSLGVELPIQDPGSINLTRSPGSDGGLVFYLRAVSGGSGGSMTERSANLISGALTGTLGADTLATGTLTASWSAPATGCDSGETSSKCAEGSLKLTFRVNLR